MITTINNKHKKLNVPNLRFPEFEGEWCKFRSPGTVHFGVTVPLISVVGFFISL